MFRFENISYLLLLLLLPVLVYLFYWYKTKQKKEWEAFAQNPNWEKFTYGIRKVLHWKILIMGSLILFLGILAISNPQYNQASREVEIESSDIFIAMDISHSMLANDLKPNRLTRAKNLSQQIIESLEGNKVGLILFAGEAYMFMPLTDDISSAISFVQSANTNMAPTQGTAIAAAMELAMNSFGEDNDAGKSIVLISDGEDHEKEIDDAIERARDEQVYVFTVAVGTDQGAFLPGMGRDNYLFDEQGKPVKSIVNEGMLREIAEKTYASSFNLSKEKNIDQAIANNISQMEKQVTEMVRFSDFDSRYQWLLFPIILLLLWQLIGPFLGSFLQKEKTS